MAPTSTPSRAAGANCLDLALEAGDVSTFRLLLAAGATVTDSEVYSALDSRKVDVLEAVVSTPGADPNRRRTPGPVAKERDWLLFAPEWYPLYHAATFHLPGPWASIERSLEKGGRDEQHAQIATLLRHGADPYAVFEHPGLGQRSVLHALLEDGGFVQPLLEMPNLDTEHFDPQGRTLLLSACRSLPRCGHSDGRRLS